MIYITRKEHFNAAHKLYNPDGLRKKTEMYSEYVPMKIGMDIIMKF